MGTSQTDLDLPLVRALQAGDESALNELIANTRSRFFDLSAAIPATSNPRATFYKRLSCASISGSSDSDRAQNS